MQPAHERQANFHVVTGKPIESGGSVGRDKATGQGVVFLIERWAQEHDFDLSQATYIVQGYGNVGSWAARLLSEFGAKLIAVEDASGAIARAEGIDADALAEYVNAKRKVIGYPGSERIDHMAFLSTEADIFIPAALDSQITDKTAPMLKVKLLAEGANGPTSMEGDEILQEKGINIIPDVLCNAGGVIVSYFEWLQNKRAEFWDLDEVDSKLHKMLMRSYDRVTEAADKYDTDWRTAAYIVGVDRLEKAYKNRGIFP